MPNSAAGVFTGAHDSNRVVSACGLNTVEAQQVPDGHEEGTIIVADAEYVRMKSYQRPVS